MNQSHSISLVTIVLIFLVSLGAAAKDREAPTETEIDALAERALEAFDVPGIAIGIIKDGEVIHAKGYGIRKFGAPEKVDADTLFQIASNTKSMTAAALAILIDEGKLNWDDKVTEHIPEFRMFEPYATREFTIKDLLTHRSGLPRGAGDLLWWPEGDLTEGGSMVEDILKALPFLKPATSFRSGYAYDNLLYYVAGEVIVRANGTRYGDFVERRIFSPLGMDDCVASHARVPAGANEAHPHAMQDGTLRPISFYQSRETDPFPAVGVNCSINGMLKWVEMQLNHGEMENGERLFSKERHGEMWTPVTITNARAPEQPGEKVAIRHYALGWRILEDMNRQIIFHQGGLPGMYTSMFLIPEENLGILVLTNQQNGFVENAINSELLSGYLNHDEEMNFEAHVAASRDREDNALEEMAKLWAARDKDSPPSLALPNYAQTYSDNWYGDVSIELDGDSLRFVSHRTNKLAGTLRHFEGDRFVVEWDDRSYVADAYLTFILDADGKVERILMEQFDPRTDFSLDFWDLDLRPKK